MFDVRNPNKGLLLSRVALTGTDDVATITSPAVSLMVYKTANSTAVIPGIFYWNGTKWATMSGIAGWSVTGNAGTVDGTNFIGTTANVPLNFKVNGQKEGRIENTGGNTFLGYLSGAANAGGTNNIALGFNALNKNTTGFFNNAIGYQALYNNTIGLRNVEMGYEALLTNTTGDDNVANSVSFLSYNT